jgi:hypothetical protein|tara:strand:- start:1888 stop:2031 length:144 start_codon:yes stop_codon:yes gene_type:complete
MFGLFYYDTLVAQHPTREAVLAEAYSLNMSKELNRMVVGRILRTGLV